MSKSLEQVVNDLKQSGYYADRASYDIGVDARIDSINGYSPSDIVMFTESELMDMLDDALNGYTVGAEFDRTAALAKLGEIVSDALRGSVTLYSDGGSLKATDHSELVSAVLKSFDTYLQEEA